MTTIYIWLPFLAGLIGGMAGMSLKGRLTRDVKVLLAFSGAYLLALSVLHLLPQIYARPSDGAGIFILVGFLLQMVLDYFSRGVEHGHIHNSELESFPLGIYLGLFLHSLIEGLPLAGNHIMHTDAHGLEGEGLLLGIAIHKIPEAMALAALLYYYFNRKSQVLLYILIYSLATPIGIGLGHLAMVSGIDDPEALYAKILGIAVGIFLHVSTTIIFEADESHRLSWRKVVAILAGLGLVLLV